MPIALFVSNAATGAAESIEVQQQQSETFAADPAAALRSRFMCFWPSLCAIMASQVGGIAHLYSRVELLGGFGMAAMAVQALSIASITLVLAVLRVGYRFWFVLGNLCCKVWGWRHHWPNGVAGVIAAAVLA